MRCAEAMSMIWQDECARTVVRRRRPASLSMPVAGSSRSHAGQGPCARCPTDSGAVRLPGGTGTGRWQRATSPAVAGVARWLRAYRGRASAPVLVAARSARPRRTTMHSATLPIAAGGPAGLAECIGPAMIARYFFDCAGTEAGAHSGSPTLVMGVCWASLRAGGDFAAISGAVSRAGCVPLLTMAWPPSPTDALTDDWLRSRGASDSA